MGIDKFIPDESQNWSIKHNTIYYFKSGYIPILKQIDGLTFVSLDLRITKAVIKIVKKITKLNEKFLFCDRLTISEKHIYREDLPRIINNYLFCISDQTFFNFIKDSEFDFINNIINFLDTFSSHKLFKKCYDHLKVYHFDKMWIDWYTNCKHYTVKNQEIRDYYQILERQIKLSIFFS